MKKKTLVIFLMIIMVLAVISPLVINELTKNSGKIIPLDIIVDDPNPSLNENVRFRLDPGNDYPFHIEDAMYIARIPDEIDPSTAWDNADFMNYLGNGVCDLTFCMIDFDYGNEDKTLLLEWNCTKWNPNPLTSGDYVRAPAGYYILYHGPMSSNNNDNTVEFRSTAKSIFYLDGLNPSIKYSYNATNGTMDVKLSAMFSGNYSNAADLSIGVYISRGGGWQEEKRLNGAIMAGSTVTEHLSGLDVRNGDSVLLFAMMRYEGCEYLVREQFVIT